MSSTMTLSQKTSIVRQEIADITGGRWDNKSTFIYPNKGTGKETHCVYSSDHVPLNVTGVLGNCGTRGFSDLFNSSPFKWKPETFPSYQYLLLDNFRARALAIYLAFLESPIVGNQVRVMSFGLARGAYYRPRVKFYKNFVKVLRDYEEVVFIPPGYLNPTYFSDLNSAHNALFIMWYPDPGRITSPGLVFNMEDFDSIEESFKNRFGYSPDSLLGFWEKPSKT